MNIRKIKKLFDPVSRFKYFDYLGFYNFLPDEVFLKKKYKLIFGKTLNLEDPQTFNEKLQWLKLYDRKPLYTTMVDKYLAKDYVASKIGDEYIIPTLGVWDCFEDINFDKLPNQFVLKCTHDSGGLVICRDKTKLDLKTAKKKISKSLKHDYYYGNREWPYKNVSRKIIAEQYMEEYGASELKDYKFFCFNGKPKFLYVSEGMENHRTARLSFVTLDWKQAEFYREDYQPFETLPEKPYSFELMIELAKKLSRDIPFLRVDFYEVNKKVYFGELTFFTAAGFAKFIPNEWDKIIGKWIILPKK